MKRAVAHWPDQEGAGVPVVALRDDETGLPFCLGCQLLIAEDDEDQRLGLPLGQAVFDFDSGYLVVLCPDCRSTFSNGAAA